MKVWHWIYKEGAEFMLNVCLYTIYRFSMNLQSALSMWVALVTCINYKTSDGFLLCGVAKAGIIEWHSCERLMITFKTLLPATTLKTLLES